MAKKSSSEERRSAAREHARQIAEAQAKREKTVKRIVYAAIGLVIAVVVAVVGTLVWQSSRPGAVPQNVASGAIAFASSGDGVTAVAPSADPEEVEASGLPDVASTETDPAAPRVKVYLDFQCPGCAAFEEANASTLERLVADGTVIAEYEPVAILDRSSGGNEYSTRSANMVTCVADSGQADTLLDVYQALFLAQPEQGGSGMEDDELLAIAEEAGVDLDAAASEAAAESIDADGGVTVRDCVTNVAFGGYVGSETQTALNDEGLEGTPLITVDGEPYQGDWSDREAFAADMLRAADQIG